VNDSGFLTPDESALGAAFLQRGYVVVEVEDAAALERIRRRVAEAAAAHLDLEPPEQAQAFLDSIHRHVGVESLNALRLAVIDAIRADETFASSYHALARRALAALVGNELAMQRGFGLSVQLPDDGSSLLQLHADVWDGDSPFEVVAWLPLVDCHDTKSMYFVDLRDDRPLQADLAKLGARSAEAVWEAVADKASFLDVPYGKILLFSQTAMHGNRVNRESETRWSLNCRFKSLLSPYADKRLGEFFEPITLRPATRLGLDYRLPDGFDE